MPANQSNKNLIKITNNFLLPIVGMVFVSKLRNKRIGFNPRPTPKIKKPKKQILEKPAIDLHLEIVEKVDELIKEHRKEVTNEEDDTRIVTEQTTDIIPRETHVERRKPISKKIEPSTFVQNIQSPDNISKNIGEEFSLDPTAANHPEFRFITNLELELPEITPRIQDVAILPETNKGLLDRLLGIDTDNTNARKESMGLFTIKMRSREEVTQLKQQKNQDEKSPSTTKLRIIKKTRSFRNKTISIICNFTSTEQKNLSTIMPTINAKIMGKVE